MAAVRADRREGQLRVGRQPAEDSGVGEAAGASAGNTGQNRGYIQGPREDGTQPEPGQLGGVSRRRRNGTVAAETAIVTEESLSSETGVSAEHGLSGE